MGVAILVLVLAVAYFVPTIKAATANHPHADKVFLVNLLLGWTVIGWAVAMGIATTRFR